MRRLIYFVRAALNNIRRNKVMSFFLLASLSLTLMLFGLFLLIYDNVQGFITSVQEDVQFSVYLKDAVTENEIRQIKEQLSVEKGVLSFRYLSKKEAMILFQKEFQDGALLKDLGVNPLPASLEVKVRSEYQDPQKLSRLVGRFHQFPGVEEVQYGAEWLQNLNAILEILKIVGIGAGVLLSVTVIAIVSNTVRLHMLGRREEIEIMKLLGATHHFIKMPFFLEGMLMGLLSGLCSVGLLFAVYRAFHLLLRVVGGMMGGLLNVHFLGPSLVFGLILVGGVLGGMGSFISLSRLLKIHAVR